MTDTAFLRRDPGWSRKTRIVKPHDEKLTLHFKSGLPTLRAKPKATRSLLCVDRWIGFGERSFGHRSQVDPFDLAE
jgi:hypothetical protein